MSNRGLVPSVGLLLSVAIAGCTHSGNAATTSSVTSPAVSDRPLVGTRWQLDASKATLSISGSELSATNGCQSLEATVTVEPTSLGLVGSRLSAGPFCPTPDEPGQAVFQVLATSPVSWQVHGDRLTITDLGGHALNYHAG